jgi:3-hydroxybutyryl-CoA dehydrogenase
LPNDFPYFNVSETHRERNLNRGEFMKSVGIIGAGTMGSEIVQLVAESDYDVIVYDIDEGASKKLVQTIQKRLNSAVKKEKITHEEVGQVMSKIKTYNTIDCMKNLDLIIECATEDIDIKQDIFKKLDDICGAAAILATNTSSISITEIASVTKRPESVVGLHFLYPARRMKLVEIVPGLLTTRETFEMAKTFVKSLGKEFVEAKDYPGFILNRMVYSMINEAIFLLYEGAGTAESIDKTLQLGLNLPMGPLRLADLIGLDIVLAVGNEMFRGYHDTKYRPCPMLKRYVSAGFLGKKTGRGFYIY